MANQALSGCLLQPRIYCRAQPRTAAFSSRSTAAQLLHRQQSSRCHARRVTIQPCRAQETDTSKAETVSSTQKSSSRPQGDWVPVISPEDFPKGVRKEVRVDGVDVLIFWYRNEIFAIEARSPAEGAYSEGFITSKLNQEYCIECPGTGSLFDFRTGEIKDWYPSNPVLRFLTPASTCRNLETYPVHLEEDAILIDVSNSAVFGRVAEQTRGGANTSLENNNVYGLEPKVYVETEEDRKDSTVDVSSVATNVVAITGAAALAVAGTATAKYWQTDIGLYAFWAVYIVSGGAFIASRLRKSTE